MDGAAHAGVEQHRRVAAVRNPHRIVVFGFRRRGEHNMPGLDFDNIDAEQLRHRWWRHRAVLDAVEKVEKGIKAVSDETMKDGQRTLRGVVRVGPSAKGVLLASERQCHLVTLTQAPPTSTY